MLDRAALDVLAHAAEIGLPEAVHVPATAYDPLLRPLILKRVSRAMQNASSQTTRPSGDHLLRLAFLLACPEPPALADPNDDRAVSDAFDRLARPTYLPPRDALRPERGGGAYRATAAERDATDPIVAPPRRKRKFWPATTAVIVTMLLSAVTVAGILMAPYWLPTPMARFSKTPFGGALGEPLTDAIVSPSSATTRAKLLTPPIRKQVGDPTVDSLSRVLAAIPEVSRSKTANTDDALSPIFLGVNDVNARLLADHVPALLHTYASGSVGRRSIWLTSYFVERRHDLVVDGKSYRSAWGRRLDRLNLSDNTLFKGDHEDWVIVSLDHVDEEFVQGFLTQLAQGKPMLPDEFASTQDGPRGDLVKRASAIVSAELSTVAHVTTQEAQAVHDAIAARNDTIMSLGKMGFTYAPSSKLKLPPVSVASLETTAQRGGYESKLAREALRLDDRMKVVAKPLASAITLLAEIEEEEFAFRLAEQARLTAAATERANRQPDDDDTRDDAENDDATKDGIFMPPRVRAMVAAQLATLSRAKTAPRLTLWLLIRRAIDTQGIYRDAAPASLALSAVLRQLQGLRGGDVDPLNVAPLTDDVYRAALAALEADPARIREAADRIYTDFLKRPVPAFSRTALR